MWGVGPNINHLNAPTWDMFLNPSMPVTALLNDNVILTINKSNVAKCSFLCHCNPIFIKAIAPWKVGHKNKLNISESGQQDCEVLFTRSTVDGLKHA